MPSARLRSSTTRQKVCTTFVGPLRFYNNGTVPARVDDPDSGGGRTWSSCAGHRQPNGVRTRSRANHERRSMYPSDHGMPSTLGSDENSESRSLSDNSFAYVSVRILSCSSWRFALICSVHGERSMRTIGLPVPIVRMTRWKYDGGNASVGKYRGASPTLVYV